VRTLLVAPSSDLPLVQAELDIVASLLSAQTLTGDVTVARLLQRLTARSRFDVLWFATHGDEKGIHLTDGLLETSTLTQLVKASKANLLVLNTCASEDVGQQIYRSIGINVICSIKDIPDRRAFTSGTLFAMYLAQTGSIRQSFECMEATDDYRWFGSKRPMNWDDGSEQRYQELSRKCDRILTVVDGSKDLGVVGIRERIDRLTAQLTDILTRMTELEEAQHTGGAPISESQARQIALSIAVAVLSTLLGIVLLRGGG